MVDNTRSFIRCLGSKSGSVRRDELCPFTRRSLEGRVETWIIMIVTVVLCLFLTLVHNSRHRVKDIT